MAKKTTTASATPKSKPKPKGKPRAPSTCSKDAPQARKGLKCCAPVVKESSSDEDEPPRPKKKVKRSAVVVMPEAKVDKEEANNIEEDSGPEQEEDIIDGDEQEDIIDKEEQGTEENDENAMELTARQHAVIPEKVMVKADQGKDVALFFSDVVQVKFVPKNSDEEVVAKGKWCYLCK
ncbi:hypothetical protein H0H87_002997 [Tephrocybe sp. NHM501043]|nr:hypothetical protein H0H87_002997 [Tephrocybe sp. NHM501043]